MESQPQSPEIAILFSFFELLPFDLQPIDYLNLKLKSLCWHIASFQI